jgi:hypothetical protein
MEEIVACFQEVADIKEDIVFSSSLADENLDTR